MVAEEPAADRARLPMPRDSFKSLPLPRNPTCADVSFQSCRGGARGHCLSSFRSAESSDTLSQALLVVGEGAIVPPEEEPPGAGKRHSVLIRDGAIKFAQKGACRAHIVRVAEILL
jgi:hypothetical protein